MIPIAPDHRARPHRERLPPCRRRGPRRRMERHVANRSAAGDPRPRDAGGGHARTVTKLVALGYEVVVETGAGRGQQLPRRRLRGGRCRGSARRRRPGQADVVLRVNAPATEEIAPAAGRRDADQPAGPGAEPRPGRGAGAAADHRAGDGRRAAHLPRAVDGRAVARWRTSPATGR